MPPTAGEIEAVLKLRDELTTELRSVLGNVKEFSTTFQKEMRDVSRSMTEIGSTLSMAVSVPLAAVGAASLKFAADFQATTTKVSTLAGEAVSSLAGIRSELIQMAPAVGIGPQALAEGLLVVESTGIKGAEAMTILDRASKSSAVGLGETKDVARALTSAITAYGTENLSASKAADILFATVKAGGAEANEVAGTLGRVVGIAAQTGVKFDELGAFIATFTRLGVDAAEATTALRGVLSTVLKPSDDARKQLQELGFSVEELRASIKEKGLTQAMIDLVKLTKGNDDALAAIIPNIRALAGVMGTAGAQGDQMKAVLDEIANSTGVLDEGFTTASQTASFMWEQFKASTQAAAIELGQVLLPYAIEAGKKISELVAIGREMIAAFNELPKPVKDTAVALAAVATIGGPALIAAGTAIKLAAFAVDGLLLSVRGAMALLPTYTAETTAAAAANTALAGSASAASRGVGLFSGSAGGATLSLSSFSGTAGSVTMGFTQITEAAAVAAPEVVATTGALASLGTVGAAALAAAAVPLAALGQASYELVGGWEGMVSIGGDLWGILGDLGSIVRDMAILQFRALKAAVTEAWDTLTALGGYVSTGWRYVVDNIIPETTRRAFALWLEDLRAAREIIGGVAAAVRNQVVVQGMQNDAVTAGSAMWKDLTSGGLKPAGDAQAILNDLTGKGTVLVAGQKGVVDGVTLSIGKQAKATRELTDEEKKLQKEQAARIATMTGGDVIKKATVMVADYHQAWLAGADVASMVPAQQKAIADAMFAAMQVFNAAGTTIPADIRAMYDEANRGMKVIHGLLLPEDLITSTQQFMAGIQAREDSIVQYSKHVEELAPKTVEAIADMFSGKSVFAGASTGKPSMLAGLFGSSAEFGTMLSSSVMSAIQGGGDVLNAAGGAIGTRMMTGIAKDLTTKGGVFLTGALGSVVNSVLPGIGALIGPLASKIGSMLFKTEGKHVNDMRDEFLSKFGGSGTGAGSGFGELARQLADIGPVGTAAFNQLTRASTDSGFKTAVDAVNAALAMQKEKLAEVASAADLAAAAEHKAIDGIAAKYADSFAKIDSEYKSLSDAVSGEAEEEFMGALETQQRARMADLELQRAALNDKKETEIAAARESMSATDQVSESLATVGSQLTTQGSAWDSWADTAVSAADRVFGAVNAVSFGHSPGGIKEIPLQLDRAVDSAVVFGNAFTGQMVYAEGAATDLGTAWRDIGPTNMEDLRAPVAKRTAARITPGEGSDVGAFVEISPGQFVPKNHPLAMGGGATQIARGPRDMGPGLIDYEGMQTAVDRYDGGGGMGIAPERGHQEIVLKIAEEVIARVAVTGTRDILAQTGLF